MAVISPAERDATRGSIKDPDPIASNVGPQDSRPRPWRVLGRERDVNTGRLGGIGRREGRMKSVSDLAGRRSRPKDQQAADRSLLIDKSPHVRRGQGSCLVLRPTDLLLQSVDPGLDLRGDRDSLSRLVEDDVDESTRRSKDGDLYRASPRRCRDPQQLLHDLGLGCRRERSVQLSDRRERTGLRRAPW